MPIAEPVAAVAEMSYEAYKALKTPANALAPVLARGELAAAEAIVGSTAAVLGAGLLGWYIGDAILKKLERPEVLPELDSYYEAGNVGEQAQVVYDYYQNGNPLYIDALSVVMPTPIKGSFFQNEPANHYWYVIDGNGNRRQIVGYGGTTYQPTRFVVKGFVKVPGSQPITPTKKLPSSLPRSPGLPVPVPTTVPVPGQPDFPITPTVVPNPGNNPEDDTETKPGVIVQIPELGLQIRYTPSGVSLGRYKNPGTLPFEVPQIELPESPPKVAAPPCPCPEEDVDFSEVLCRIKQLEEGLLQGDPDRTEHPTPSSSGTYVTNLPDTLLYVRMNVDTVIANPRIQPGNNGEPDVYYMGWFAWHIAGGWTHRQAIDYRDFVAVAPVGADGYLYTMWSGYKASSIAITIKATDYVDNC